MYPGSARKLLKAWLPLLLMLIPGTHYYLFEKFRVRLLSRAACRVLLYFVFIFYLVLCAMILKKNKKKSALCIYTHTHCCCCHRRIAREGKEKEGKGAMAPWHDDRTHVYCIIWERKRRENVRIHQRVIICMTYMHVFTDMQPIVLDRQFGTSERWTRVILPTLKRKKNKISCSEANSHEFRFWSHPWQWNEKKKSTLHRDGRDWCCCRLELGSVWETRSTCLSPVLSAVLAWYHTSIILLSVTINIIAGDHT